MPPHRLFAPLRLYQPPRPVACRGREGVIAELVGCFQGARRVVTLVGAPGCGKTTIARAFVHALAEFDGLSPFDGVLWLSGDSEDEAHTLARLRQGLADALGQRHIGSMEEQEADRALAESLRATRTLVVLDDVTVGGGLRMFVEAVPISLLATTTDEEIDFHRVVAVPQLASQELSAIAGAGDSADGALPEDVQTPLAAVIARARKAGSVEFAGDLPADGPARRILDMACLMPLPVTMGALRRVFREEDEVLDTGVAQLVALGLAEKPELFERDIDMGRLEIPGHIRKQAREALGDNPKREAALLGRFVEAHFDFVWRSGLLDAGDSFGWYAGMRLELVERIEPALSDILRAIDVGLKLDGHVEQAIDLGIGVIHLVWEAGWTHRRVRLARDLADTVGALLDADGSKRHVALPGSKMSMMAARAWCLFDGLAWAYQTLGNLEAAHEAIKEGLEVARAREELLARDGDPPSTRTLWFARYRQGDILRARGAFREARALLEECWVQSGVASARGGAARALGKLARRRGETDAAWKWFQLCLIAERAAHSAAVASDPPPADARRDRRRYAARALMDLAELALDADGLDRCEALLRQATESVDDGLFALRTHARVAMVQGRLYQRMGRFDDAREELYKSRTLYRLAGSAPEVDEAQWSLGEVSRRA